MHWDLVAEDGNRYPYPRTQYTALLSAMKTRDAILVPGAAGTYPVFDRRLNLSNNGNAPGGMLVQLSVDAGALTAVDDSATTDEETAATIAVLTNDPGATGVESITQPANGEVTTNGTDVTYTPNPDFFGTDAFTYRATDGNDLSNWATVTVTVTNINDPPVANDDSEVAEGGELYVPAPGVLNNDNDADGDPLTAVLDTDAGAGTLTLNPDGSFTYTPDTDTTDDFFTYFANDSTVNSAERATVTITVTAPPPNQPPVANHDFATTTRNTAVTINLTANDTDPDGNLDPASVVVGTVSSRGGTITNLGNGSVVYTPRRNFRGTDTFTYSVFDSGTPPLESNDATVTVNVVR
jgi:VCBS repeat-containing protein